MNRKSEITRQGSPRHPTLVSLLIDRVGRHPDRTALTFHDDEGNIASLSYRDLLNRVNNLSEELHQRADHNLQPGDRALLLFPAGLDFVVAFLACQRCRLVPVPTCFPKPGRAMPRLDAAAADCAPRYLLSDRKTLEGIDPLRVSAVVTQLQQVAMDGCSFNAGETMTDADCGRSAELAQPHQAATELGLLQYTSGSTSEPKGVMVTNANLMANFEAIRLAFDLAMSETADDAFTHSVFWLPPFHDMGLIGGILETLYIGGHAELMSPRGFLSRPLRWLEMISKTGATVSGAPNFAYELCVDRISSDEAAELDLSRWRIAFCGAEPISAETLQRFTRRFSVAGFRTSSLLPCYGMAEATLLVASRKGEVELPCLTIDRESLRHGRVVPVTHDHPRERVHTLVSCGRPAAGTTIKIVDPQTRIQCEESRIGEIWLQGESIASGYWQKETTTAECFHAKLAESDVDDHSAGEYFRSGDLGFIHDNELYITGRYKDVIIVRGRNHYPQDVEATVQQTLKNDFLNAVALATSGFTGEALSVVVEVSRHLSDDELPSIVRRIRRRIIEEHEIDARQIYLCKPGTIPLTTSGKVQRSACRRILEADELAARYQWCRPIVSDDSYAAQLPTLPETIDADSAIHAQHQIEAWLMAWLVARCGVDLQDVSPKIQFAEHGLDSMSAVELSGEIDDWLGVELTPLVAVEHPTPAMLAKYLVEQSLEMRGAPGREVGC